MPEPEVVAPMTESHETPATHPNVFVGINFLRDKGKCIMKVNAKGLHDYLDSIGVTRNSNGSFNDRPMNSNLVCDTSYHVLHCGALLGSIICTSNGVAEFNLMSIYTSYPTVEVLRKLGESTRAVVNEIIDHYRPVEISIVISEKRKAV